MKTILCRLKPATLRDCLYNMSSVHLVRGLPSPHLWQSFHDLLGSQRPSVLYKSYVVHALSVHCHFSSSFLIRKDTRSITLSITRYVTLKPSYKARTYHPPRQMISQRLPGQVRPTHFCARSKIFFRFFTIPSVAMDFSELKSGLFIYLMYPVCTNSPLFISHKQ